MRQNIDDRRETIDKRSKIGNWRLEIGDVVAERSSAKRSKDVALPLPSAICYLLSVFAICYLPSAIFTGCVSSTVKEKKQIMEIAVIETDKGIIKFEFFKEDAPNTVDNFKKLADKKFYDGLKFHRVVPGFVIQGGCPLGNGTGDPGYKIKAEFNSKPHLDGTVAMARSNHPDSAGSQFYICLGTKSFLDGKYTVFGQVTEGLDVVHKIQIGDVMKKVYITKKKN